MTLIDEPAPAAAGAMRLQGRTAAVTGGGAGIGAAICRRLAAEGAAVAALDIALPSAQRTVDAMGGGLAVVADVSDSAAVDRAIAHVERHLGPLDILVNNAGAVGLDHVGRVTPLLERQREEAARGRVETPLDALVRLSDEEWRRIVAVHLDGTFYCTRAAVRSMAARRTGTIVNMASICGLEGCTGHPHYSAAKAGILGFTRSAAKELVVQGIRVNAVAPGFFASEMTAELGDDPSAFPEFLLARTPLGRGGRAGELDDAVLFLLGAGSSFVTGHVLSVDGGMSVR
jgi:3-oxoacyl-[acyl-carrier protein] reductase